jgi:hypothetical protein
MKTTPGVNLALFYISSTVMKYRLLTNTATLDNTITQVPGSTVSTCIGSELMMLTRWIHGTSHLVVSGTKKMCVLIVTDAFVISVAKSFDTPGRAFNIITNAYSGIYFSGG